KAKIFTLTSKLEGFPLVFSEAVNYGCLVISSDVDAAYDITKNGETGFIFTYPNVDELANCIVNAVNYLDTPIYKYNLERTKDDFDFVKIINNSLIPHLK